MKTIRIGTRDSQLALWQAHHVEKKLNDLGYPTEIVAVKSDGDLNLSVPLYEMGITGIFTKTLDIAMINGQIDIAVHSMKDVPTALPKGMVQAAVLERANVHDILVHKGNLDFLYSSGTIATGSLRRQAQWLDRHPHHEVVDLRGNVNTRLRKLKDSNWDGAIFAAAGLERIGLTPENHINLDWMIPAPAQGAMVVMAMVNDDFSREATSKLNHHHTQICTETEREFLKVLEGGCTAPIGALAEINDGHMTLNGVLFSLDGKEKIHVEKTVPVSDYRNVGSVCAVQVIENGGREIMEKIKSDLRK